MMAGKLSGKIVVRTLSLRGDMIGDTVIMSRRIVVVESGIDCVKRMRKCSFGLFRVLSSEERKEKASNAFCVLVKSQVYRKAFAFQRLSCCELVDFGDLVLDTRVSKLVSERISH